MCRDVEFIQGHTKSWAKYCGSHAVLLQHGDHPPTLTTGISLQAYGNLSLHPFPLIALLLLQPASSVCVSPAAAEDVLLRCVCCSWCCESGRWQTPPITRLFHNTRVAPYHCRRDEEPPHDGVEGGGAMVFCWLHKPSVNLRWTVDRSCCYKVFVGFVLCCSVHTSCRLN